MSKIKFKQIEDVILDRQMISFLEFDSYSLFPRPGRIKVIYFDKSTEKSYRWDDEVNEYVPFFTDGLQGKQGLQGYQGFQGKTGVQGFQGYRGTDGADGIQGFQGFQGHQGHQGYQGLQGYQGFQGKTGVQGYQGYQGKSGVDGADGIQGYQGLQGSTGPKGSSGIQGFQGIPGLTGSDGIQGYRGYQGIQGIKGDGSEIRAREANESIPSLNETKTYERKYIHVTNDGLQSVVSHTLVNPTTSTKEVTLDLSSNIPLQIQEYTFDNAGHVKEIGETNVTFDLGIEVPDKTDWQETPLAGLLDERIPDSSEYPTDVKPDELKGWVYQGSLQTVKDLENLRVGDVISYYEGGVLVDVTARGQVYRLKQQYSSNFLTQDSWSVLRYKGQMVGYTDSSSLTDVSQLNDIAFMHHLPEYEKLSVITNEDELEYYKTKLTQRAEQYPDSYLEGFWSRISYTHPETGEQIREGVLYWRIEKVESVLDFGDELATASTTANQITNSTEKIYNKINEFSNNTFVSAWIQTLDNEEYEYNGTERTYIWNIAYSRLVQNNVSPETASVITLRQLQEDGIWKQLIPDVVFNDNKSCLEIRFSELPKNTMKVLVTGNRIKEYSNENPNEPVEPTKSIGTITDDNSIVIDETQLENGTYTLRYIDSNENTIDNFNEITSFEIDK